ncbi:MAG: hypothetical protein ACPGVT_04045, partial [Maricaulaceae bacterium]
MTNAPNEEVDIKFLTDFLFTPNGIEARRFTDIETKTGKTPDFKLFIDGIFVAYCELKSPRDDWLQEQSAKSSPEGIYGGARDDSIFNKIRKHVKKAAKQFEAIDPNCKHAHILIFLNHNDMSDKLDFFTAMNGVDIDDVPAAPRASKSARMATAWIDLVIWIDKDDCATS